MRAALGMVLLFSACPANIDLPVDSGTRMPTTDAGVDSVELVMTLGRDDAGVVVDVQVRLAVGPSTGLEVRVATSDNGIASTVTEIGDGGYRTHVASRTASGQIAITASVLGRDLTRTAVVVPYINERWSQPELVPGLVNTPGTEDSATVSPDGEWLVVGTYSPVDILCCLGLCTGTRDGRSPACQRANGPISGPARPGMPGAQRVLSSTQISNGIRDFCTGVPDGGELVLPMPDGGSYVFPNPPVSAYGFHRARDGAFDSPFSIAFDIDGFVGAPFCFSFLGAPQNGTAQVVYSYQRQGFETVNRPFVATLPLGAPVSLGAFRCVGGSVEATGELGKPVGAAVAQSVGNASYSSGYLFGDDESVSPSLPLVASVSGELPNVTVGEWQAMPIPADGQDRRHPVVESGRLFYARELTVTSIQWTGADPSMSTSFAGPLIELAPEGLTTPLQVARVGQIFALGQPTFAHLADGNTEMYFVFYQVSSTGTDGQVARVRLRR